MKYAVKELQLSVCLLGGAIGVFLVLIEYFGVLQPFRPGIEKLVIPWQARGARIARLGLTPISLLEKTLKDYHYTQDLELRLSEAMAQAERVDLLQTENEELRALLDLPEPEAGRRLLGVSILSYGRPLVQLSGAAQPPSLGSPILAHGTVLGRVTAVHDDFLELVLLHEEQSKALLVRTDSEAEGLLVGNGKQILLTELDRQKSVQPGEAIYTLGQEAVPPGLFVGRVQRLITPESSPVQIAVISQLESFYESSIVEIRGQ